MADAYKLGRGTTWKNRIVGHAMIDPEQLLANERNPRGHPKYQQDVLTGVLSEIGWIDDVIVNIRSSELWDENSRGVETMIDGHLRVELALRNGEPEIPVKYVDLDPHEEALALATFDPIGALANINRENLESLIADIETNDEAITSLLDELLDNSIGEEIEEVETAEDVDAEPELSLAQELQAKWGTATGQIWKLGDHRIICGDSRNPAVFKALMEGFFADMVATDPPYGVGYVGKTDDELPVHNDDKAGLLDLLQDALGLAHEYSRQGAAWYVAAPHGPNFYDFAIVLSGLNVWRQTLVWVKQQMVMGHSDYHYKHESIFYGWKDGAAHKTPPDRKQTSVLEFNKPQRNELHPTMKPVELYDYFLKMSSIPGDMVLEPFLGSGTTLIACERNQRQCRGIEIAPEYLAVVIERWVEATKGGVPELLETIEIPPMNIKIGQTADKSAVATRFDVPDALWPTDNELGIPLLDINMQATSVDSPLLKWGYYSRRTVAGTYHFYTEDHKFEALWNDPSSLLLSGAKSAVEPNFSTTPHMPVTIVAYQTYRKRWIARWWQSKGVRIFVDLNVDNIWENINLMGVPKGWSAYFVRSIETLGLHGIKDAYEIAVRHAAGNTPLFVVYGGGQSTRRLCLDNGWLWVPENSHVQTGKFTGGVYDRERLLAETDAEKTPKRTLDDVIE